MHSDNKLPTVEFTDPIISAEIPDKIEDPKLYSLVNEFMIHGPHGAENINCPCMGSSIKYLFKYTNKGPDRATVAVVRANNEYENNDVVDEIAEYYDCRYLSACEASWRIFKYDVHCRYPSVARLHFHLPNQQQIVYGEDDDIDDVLDKPSIAA
ncbi:unnamed protein product [Lactuca virosa]|uniref:Uncharacterized protein n=1 Tax=Lactuca virosa TaxID=75947 RepID=A0AAU9LNT4_9ASTR|nr:unnamed protein product [Lactuca virosa]